jgi:hypothetical protein
VWIAQHPIIFPLSILRVCKEVFKIVRDVVGSILITGIFSAKANVEMVPSTINIDLGRISSDGG